MTGAGGGADQPAVEDVVVYSDGGSRGNPGPAGYGSVVLAQDGTVLAERAEFLGRVTNNVAEYSGLIAGLAAAADLGARRVAVRVDSKLIVEQMSGRWQVKHPDMKPLARQAAGLVRGFDRVTFDWIPRAQNSHADRLANEAMDAGVDGRQWVPPAGWQTPAIIARPPDEPVGLFDPDQPAERATHDPSAVLPDRDPSGATRILVIRHGETVWGVQGRFAGREDVALTALGRREAASVGDRLKPLAPAAVLTSPLQRCRLTAEAIGAAVGAPVESTDDLLDGMLGDWTGRTAAEIEQGWPDEFARWRADPAAAPPGGESYTAIRDRVAPLLPFVAERYRGHTVVLVTHAAPSKMLVAAALDVPSTVAYRIRIDTASLSGITVDSDGRTVVWAVNETGHLPD